MKFVVFCLLFGLALSEAGEPGKDWTEKEAEIIRTKLLRIWSAPSSYFNAFDTYEGVVGEDVGYFYDPTKRLSIPNCDVNDETTVCWSAHWQPVKRRNELSFQPAKAVRLAFHDCIPYEDGTGGCDGCLNFDENLHENNGLQHTAAILEKIFTDVNFPDLPEDMENLPASPKDLGISRADLWAFAGIIALRQYEDHTKTHCNFFETSLTCGTGTCHVQFPSRALTMFKTGRVDCQPSSKASQLQQYLASKIEAHPHEGFNGEMTMKYFNDKFGLTGRQSLALMGAHTIGGFRQVSGNRDYAWVRTRSNQTELFNNFYYRIMTSEPRYMKEPHCVGKMNGEKATESWRVAANILPQLYPAPHPWATKERPGVLTWASWPLRSPNCDITEKQDKAWGHEDIERHWKNLDKTAQKQGFQSGYEMCCWQKEHGNGTYYEGCNKNVNERRRFISNDIGYYLHWDINEKGLPEGCGDTFLPDDPNIEPNVEFYENAEWLRMADCPKNTLDDGHGTPIYKMAENFAKNAGWWINTFIIAFEKMQRNGYSSLSQGPTYYPDKKCCFVKDVIVNSGLDKWINNVDGPLACQKLCQNRASCKAFQFDMGSGACQLRKEWKVIGKYMSTGMLFSGPKNCPESANSCNHFGGYLRSEKTYA